MRSIAIIPARSGSKGLPDKNIRPLNGKPLLAYSIEAALASGLFDTVHVSTDSERYADIARQYGADEPFLRSAETSSDTASSEDAIREVLRRYEEMGQRFDAFMLLQPTSPLRTADDIRAALRRDGGKAGRKRCFRLRGGALSALVQHPPAGRQYAGVHPCRRQQAPAGAGDLLPYERGHLSRENGALPPHRQSVRRRLLRLHHARGTLPWILTPPPTSCSPSAC